MEQYTLPDGRKPLRFTKGRSAYYAKLRGAGEVRYTFSMIKYMKNKRPRLTDDELSTVAKERAATIKKTNPAFFATIGGRGGKLSKRKAKI